MATTYDGRPQYRTVLFAAVVALAASQRHQVASAADDTEQSSEQAICRKVIDEMAGQIHRYCDARRLNSLQCLDFLGSHGSVSNDTLEREWIESLKSTGIKIQEVDSTRVQGRIVSQRSDNASILLLQCTLTDNNGAELKSFRLRKVIRD